MVNKISTESIKYYFDVKQDHDFFSREIESAPIKEEEWKCLDDFYFDYEVVKKLIASEDFKIRFSQELKNNLENPDYFMQRAKKSNQGMFNKRYLFFLLIIFVAGFFIWTDQSENLSENITNGLFMVVISILLAIIPSSMVYNFKRNRNLDKKSCSVIDDIGSGVGEKDYSFWNFLIKYASLLGVLLCLTIFIYRFLKGFYS